MTLLHIYSQEDGKYVRSQEPVIDPLESKLAGKDVYVTYPYSTTEDLPEYGEHEIPFFVDGKWVVKGQYKNIEVYNTENKNFEYCYTEELGDNQIWIDDKDGIEKFKKDYQKYIVDENNKIVENPKYEKIQQLNALNEQLNATETAYQEVLETPVVFPLTGKQYKPQWVDDGTYSKLVTGMLAGVVTFPQKIWDATKLEENMVEMDSDTFGKLVAFLANVQNQAFETRKYAQSELLPQIAALKEEIGE